MTVQIPASPPLICYKGFTFVFDTIVEDNSGDNPVPFDFTGCTASFEVSRGEDVLKSGAVSLSSGRMTWRILDTATANFLPCEARYVVSVVLANADKVPFFAGEFKIVNL